MRQFGLGAGALVAGLALVGVSPADAQSGGRLTAIKAGNLQRMCQAPQSLKACDGYISGISDGITLVETAAGPKVARKVCVPAVSGAQLRGSVMSWMSKHPDRLDGQIGPVVFDALAETYPCSGAGNTGAGGTP